MKNTQIRIEKKENAKVIKAITKDEKQNSAQRFIKNSVAASLTKIAVLSAHLCHDDIIYYRANENHTEHTESDKKRLPCLLLTYYI